MSELTMADDANDVVLDVREEEGEEGLQHNKTTSN